MTNKERKFVEIVWKYYEQHGRHTLPWRKTSDPYKVLVSELMLQQTQVLRVIPKFELFVKNFSTLDELAGASLKDVLVLWQGLGYNRRAKYLHETAKAVVKKYKGKLPSTYEELTSLSGIGPYTAAAVLVFAHNEPRVMIETNVRTVFLHHFFSNKTGVPDREILKLVEKTLPDGQSCNWYAALMDYGSYLKSTKRDLNQRSAHYQKQSKFKGSDREIRGAVLRFLTTTDNFSLKNVPAELQAFEPVRLQKILSQLEEESMIRNLQGRYSLE